MTTKVFPAIRKLYAGEAKVTVQHDGAPGHGKEGSNMVKQLVAAGKKRKRGEPLILSSSSSLPSRRASTSATLPSSGR